MRGHRGYNICPWLKNGKHEICGKSCREEYCKVHRFRIRNGSKIPRPCLSCGVGVISQIQLCRGCGRETERKRLVKQELQEKLSEKCILGREESAPLSKTIPLFPPFSSLTTPCPTSTPWPPTPTTKHRTYDESSGGGWRKPKESMINDEYCFGLRD